MHFLLPFTPHDLAHFLHIRHMRYLWALARHVANRVLKRERKKAKKKKTIVLKRRRAEKMERWSGGGGTWIVIESEAM